MQESSISIRNDRKLPHVIWLEPWGEDYILLPGEELIVANKVTDQENGPWFALVETEGNTQCYIERGDYPDLQINGVPVACGHNRQAAIDAGVYPD